jgi:hypothetical protein
MAGVGTYDGWTLHFGLIFYGLVRRRYSTAEGKAMAEDQFADGIDPKVASHLAESMDEAPGPETKRPSPPTAADGQQWPDGSGKHRHPKEHDVQRGRLGHEAAVNAVHRITPPDTPHSS